jgi:hypothetical protein
MAISNVQWGYHVTATESLNDPTKGTGHIYKAINVASGQITGDAQAAGGILTQPATNGSNIAFTVAGVAKYTAGGTVSANNELTVTTSGYFTAAASGDYIVGKAYADSTSGSVGTGMFDFSKNPKVDTTSAYIATYETVGVAATEDLSGAVSKAISGAGVIADGSNEALGILEAATNSGATGLIRPTGLVPWKAGNVIGIGDSLKVTSGWALAADSGDLVVGRAMQASAAGNSGSTFTAAVDFASPHYATSCLDVQY